MSKNFTKSAIDWANFMKLVPPDQRGSFYALKAKNDGYLRSLCDALSICLDNRCFFLQSLCSEMSKNFTKSAIDWANFMKLVPPDQRGSFYALKAKNDGYLRRVLANPATAPKINWEEFSKLISDKSLIEKFKSGYESFKVPYPADTLTAEVDKQWQSLIPEIKKFVDEVEALKAESNTELKRLNSLPKFDEITMEMFYDMYPKDRLDPVNNPTFWPHCADEQLGWVDPSSKAKH